MYAIVEAIPNTGSYDWVPTTALEDDVSHYGIQLIEVDTGFYQYTDQFGIANKGAVVSSSTPVKEVAPSPTPVKEDIPKYAPSEAPAKETPKSTYPVKPTEEKKEEPEASISYSTHYATLTSCDCTETPTSYAGVPTGTGSPGFVNATMYTVPTGSKPSSTAPPTAEYTGAGSQLKVGGALVVVVAGMGMCLLI
jgi:hypothetical protein